MNARSTDVDDAALLARYRAGEELAFEALFERYRAPLVRYATRLLGEPEQARDVCVDAFVKVLEGRLAPERSLKGLMFTTVHRMCIDRLRRRTRWGRVRRMFGAVVCTPSTPEQVLAEQDERARLVAAIHALPDGHRAAIGLVYDEEMPTREAAEILGITPTQLRSRLAYARRLIRAHVGEEDP